MGYTLRLRVLQDGKDEAFRKLYNAEKNQRESWHALLKASRELEDAQDAVKDALDESEEAWQRYEVVAKNLIPKLDVLLSSDRSGSPEYKRMRIRQIQALQKSIKRPRLEHQEYMKAVMIADEVSSKAQQKYLLLEKNHSEAFASLKFAERKYWSAIAALDKLVKESKS